MESACWPGESVTQMAATVACGVTGQPKFSRPRFCFPERFENIRSPHCHTAGLRGCTEGNHPTGASTCENPFEGPSRELSARALPSVPHSSLASGARASVTLEFRNLFLNSSAPLFYRTDDFGRSQSAVWERARLTGPFTLVKMLQEGVWPSALVGDKMLPHLG